MGAEETLWRSYYEYVQDIEMMLTESTLAHE
jgi:hypothetical protein